MTTVLIYLALVVAFFAGFMTCAMFVSGKDE